MNNSEPENDTGKKMIVGGIVGSDECIKSLFVVTLKFIQCWIFPSGQAGFEVRLPVTSIGSVFVTRTSVTGFAAVAISALKIVPSVKANTIAITGIILFVDFMKKLI